MFQYKTTAVIVAGGIGKRMNGQIPKQFIILNDRPILMHTLEIFEQSPFITDIVLVCVKDYINYCRELIKKFNVRKIKKIVPGGTERQFSVYNAIKDISSDFICIHDAVRPFVNLDIIQKTITESIENPGCICGIRAKDTIKICGEYVEKTLERDKLFHIQTPQTFKTKLLQRVYNSAMEEGYLGTDDSSLMEYYGYKIKIIEGLAENIKITEPQDLLIAKIYLGIEK